jgi:hypothetical protein
MESSTDHQNDTQTNIEELDFKINIFKSEKNYTECLNLIEKSIIIKSQKYGKESPEFIKTARDLCEVCNLIALSHLKNNQKEEGLSYLLRTEKLFKFHRELLSLSYNNIGCYYKM